MTVAEIEKSTRSECEIGQYPNDASIDTKECENEGRHQVPVNIGTTTNFYFVRHVYSLDSLLFGPIQTIVIHGNIHHCIGVQFTQFLNYHAVAIIAQRIEFL